MKRWRSFNNLCKSLSRSNSSGSVRSGFLAVYVGPDRQRFVIPTRFMNYPVFATLLEKAEEELGFQPAGGLALTCDVAFFRWVIGALEGDEERFRGMDFDGFSEIFSENSSAVGCCKDESSSGAVAARESFFSFDSKGKSLNEISF